MKKHQDLQDRVARALQTLQALPESAHTRPMGHRTAWPEMIRRTKRGAILHRGSIRFSQNSADISDCYLIIDTLYNLSEMQRMLIWARAMNVAWYPLQLRLKRSRTHLYRLHQRALEQLAQHLSEAEKK